jgi:SprT-like family
MKIKAKPIVLLTNAALRRFCNSANKRYFGGRLPIAKISFSSRLRADWHGRTFTCVYDVKQTNGRWTEFEMSHIEISYKLKRARDLCMMTVYHEMVHAELDMLGFRGKDLKCGKNSVLFNRRMTELADIGAFNGLW